MAWGADIEFYNVEGGQRLLDIVDGRGTLVLIDALRPVSLTRGKAKEQGALATGTVQRLEWPDASLEAALRPGTTHHLRPAETLHLAETLGLLPPNVLIWAIVGERFDAQSGLTPAVVAAVPDLVKRVVADLKAGEA
jgi:hydrogenase maturation protease